MVETVLLYITSGLCIGLIVLLVQSHKHVYAAKCDKKTLTRNLTELRAKMIKDADDFRHTANQLRAHYEKYVDWQKKEISGGDGSHVNWSKELDKIISELEKGTRGVAVQREYDRITEEMNRSAGR